jgi:hypothetical protein
MRRGAMTPLLRDDGRRRESEQNAVSEPASLCHGMPPDASFEMARGGLQRCRRVVCLTHQVLCGSIGGIFVTLNAQLVKLP